jgi:hypothetical protein
MMELVAVAGRPRFPVSERHWRAATMIVLEPEGLSCKRPRAEAREGGTSRKGDAAASFRLSH